MIKYEITRWPYDTAMKAADHIVVHRADAANRHLRRMVRDMVASEGMLDRQDGVDVINEVERFTYNAPGHGLYVLDRWRIAPGNGAYVEIFIRR
jgi:hypothetical protein